MRGRKCDAEGLSGQQRRPRPRRPQRRHISGGRWLCKSQLRTSDPSLPSQTGCNGSTASATSLMRRTRTTTTRTPLQPSHRRRRRRRCYYCYCHRSLLVFTAWSTVLTTLGRPCGRDRCLFRPSSSSCLHSSVAKKAAMTLRAVVAAPSLPSVCCCCCWCGGTQTIGRVGTDERE